MEDATTLLLPPPPRPFEKPLDASVTKPWLLELRSSDALIVSTVCLALFIDAFIYGVMVPILPVELREHLNVPRAEAQFWASSLFAVFGAAILVGSPLWGWYTDHSASRRTPLLLGLALIAAAAFMLQLGSSVWVFLLSRTLQGFSGAVVYTVGLALLVDTVGKEDVGKWMGIALSCESVGLVISPTLGGVLYKRFGMWAVTGIMVAMIVLDIIMRLIMIEKRTARLYATPAVNSAGGVIEYSTFSEVGISTTQCTEMGEPSKNLHRHNSSGKMPQIEWGEIDIPESALPTMLHLLRSPRILTAAWGVLMQFGLLASFDAVLPLFMRQAFGWGTELSGVIFLALALPALAGGFVGRISDWVGPRRVALAGCIVSAPALILLRLIDDEGGDQVLLLCVLLTIIGCGLTLIISPLAADLSFAVDEIEVRQPGIFGDKGAYGQAYALFTCGMAAAEFIGPVFAGGIKEKFGWSAMTLFLGVWCASVAIPMTLFIGDGVKFGRDGQDNEAH